MALGLNPVGDVLKKAEAELAEVQMLLRELSGELALVKEIPHLRQRLDEVHRVVHGGAADG